MIRGKRYLLCANAGAGKSLAVLVVAMEVVAHGGQVVIIERWTTWATAKAVIRMVPAPRAT